MDIDKKRIIIFPSENSKEVLTKYLKGSDIPTYGEQEVSSPKFKLKVTEDFKVQGSCEDLLGGEYLTIENFSQKFLGKLFLQNTVTNGVLVGEEFEVAASDETGKVIFVSQEMEEYDDCFDEMVRRLNVSMNKKKTRKWIPGHRYDDEQGSYYYLGKFNSHRQDDYGSEFVSGLGSVECHIVSTNCRNFKKISEVFRNKDFRDGLKVLYKLPSMIDVGQKLEDDIDSGEIDYNKDIIPDLFIRSYKQYMGGTFIDDNVIPSIFDALCYVDITRAESSVENNDVKTIMADIVRSQALKTLITFWNTNIPACKIGENVSDQDNVKYINEHVWKIDKNVLAPIYYRELYSYYGINIEEIISSCISGFSIKRDILGDFENYYKYLPYYFKYRNSDISTRNCNLRQKSAKANRYSTPEKIVSISDLFGNSEELKTLLIEMANKAKDTYGIEACHSFGIYNVGTKKDVNSYARFCINIDDILKYKKGIPGLTENLKNEIMRTQFRELMVQVDIDKKIV